MRLKVFPFAFRAYATIRKTNLVKLNFACSSGTLGLFDPVEPKDGLRILLEIGEKVECWYSTTPFVLQGNCPFFVISFTVFWSILRWPSLGPEKLAENWGETEKRAFSSSGPLRVPFLENRVL